MLHKSMSSRCSLSVRPLVVLSAALIAFSCGGEDAAEMAGEPVAAKQKPMIGLLLADGDLSTVDHIRDVANELDVKVMLQQAHGRVDVQEKQLLHFLQREFTCLVLQPAAVSILAKAEHFLKDLETPLLLWEHGATAPRAWIGWELTPYAQRLGRQAAAALVDGTEIPTVLVVQSASWYPATDAFVDQILDGIQEQFHSLEVRARLRLPIGDVQQSRQALQQAITEHPNLDAVIVTHPELTDLALTEPEWSHLVMVGITLDSALTEEVPHRVLLGASRDAIVRHVLRFASAADRVAAHEKITIPLFLLGVEQEPEWTWEEDPSNAIANDS